MEEKMPGRPTASENAAPATAAEAPSHGQAMAMANQLNHLLATDAFTGADYFYTANLSSFNDSGVTGTAIIGLDVDTNTLTVSVEATGLEPNQVHIQHIHGFTDGTDATIPTSANDTDGDGFVELLEGLVSYGGILLNLSTDHTNDTGSDNGHSHDSGLAGFPTAPDGTIHFLESYSLDTSDPLISGMLTNDHIVIHGMTVDAGVGAGTTGEVDGSGGYELVLPIAIGEIEVIDSVSALRSMLSGSSTYEGPGGHSLIGLVGHGDSAMHYDFMG
jgi:hypothetical protein